ncbi:hypothetical protein SAMN05892877_117103 [Rhizobium subbaraonis]|uniref:Uncharacterized protein n=1 Tax=Rhizobium subbaraonis TaxID=908946 RepID=A0A285UV01_9HYPH|nr:hypothetical protein [Rhizobium subbaraonis]SOC45714.1 hypothetical protein SAMN05892877_117103 [Rhizobium subbaraonis]
MRVKLGRFHDDWRGNGVFVSFIGEVGHVLFAARWAWRFDYVHLPVKPYRRLYVGPFEVEWSSPATHRTPETKP